MSQDQIVEFVGDVVFLLIGMVWGVVISRIFLKYEHIGFGKGHISWRNAPDGNSSYWGDIALWKKGFTVYVSSHLIKDGKSITPTELPVDQRASVFPKSRPSGKIMTLKAFKKQCSSVHLPEGL